MVFWAYHNSAIQHFNVFGLEVKSVLEYIKAQESSKPNVNARVKEIRNCSQLTKKKERAWVVKRGGSSWRHWGSSECTKWYFVKHSYHSLTDSSPRHFRLSAISPNLRFILQISNLFFSYFTLFTLSWSIYLQIYFTLFIS